MYYFIESFGHLCSQHPDTRNSSQNEEVGPFMNGISQNGHKGSDRISNGSVNPEKQRFFDSSAHHATGTNETDTTDVKSVYDIFPSFGESTFDNAKNPSLGTQMSAASNSEKTSPDDAARTGSTGNIPNSDLFCSLHTSNTTQNHDIGEGPKSDNSVARNTNKTKTMATGKMV